MERGLYKRTNWVVSDQCLGNQTVSDAVAIYNIFNDGDEMNDLLVVFNLLFQLKHENDAYCQYDDIVNDILRWMDAFNITFEVILNNILKKVIQITTVCTDISNILQDPTPKPPLTDNQYYFNQWEQMATAGGKFIRFITDFDITKLPQ